MTTSNAQSRLQTALIAGAIASALALAATPGAARAEREHVGFTYQKITWSVEKAKAETDLQLLRQRAARLGQDNSSTWLRVGQLPTSGQRTTDVTMKRGIVSDPPKPNRGQVAMETLVIQHEGMKAPKPPQSAALDDLPHPPPTPGAIAPAPRAPSQAFNPTQIRVTKTIPWKQQRGSRAAIAPKAIAATK